MRDFPEPIADPPHTAAEPPLTHLLHSLDGGETAALDQLFTRVYGELQRLAHGLRRGGAGETLCTTALVHEAYLKLVPSTNVRWESRAHFFGAAARAMRQILVSAARYRTARKRGGGEWVVTYEEGENAAATKPEELLALDAALERLSAIEPRRAKVVEHRFFAGLTAEETAKVLNVSTATVERDWRAARAWLTQEMAGLEAP